MDRTVISGAIAIAFAAGAVLVNGRYCWKTLAHRIEPRLASWLIFCVASMIGLVSYRLHEGVRASVMTNIMNHSDVLWISAITISILISARHEPERLRLSRFDRWCLALAGSIIVFWVATGSSLSANILSQVLMCVGYGPMFWSFYRTKRNTEPFDVWLATLGGVMIGIIPPLLAQPHDWLAILYACRAIFCVAVTLAMMWHYHRRAVILAKPC